jgi:hypothetical protein
MEEASDTDLARSQFDQWRETRAQKIDTGSLAGGSVNVRLIVATT